MGAAIDCRETDGGDVGADCGEKYLEESQAAVERNGWSKGGPAKEAF